MDECECHGLLKESSDELIKRVLHSIELYFENLAIEKKEKLEKIKIRKDLENAKNRAGTI